MILRPYQIELKTAIYSAWMRSKNVLAVMPCGTGKTATFCSIVNDEPGASVVMVHRSEIVVQISLTLARWGVRHRIIGPQKLINQCIAEHIIEYQKSYIDPGARCAVASVQTLVSMDANNPWFRRVSLWVCDEVHHLIKGSTWHRVTEMFPNARGLGVTATPIRTDGKGLGRQADGIMDELIEGITMRAAIDAGYICDYRIFSPNSDIDLSQVKIGASGDYSSVPLRAAVHKSQLVGDCVAHYLKHAPGKLGITFCVDVESSDQQAAAYNAAGIAAKSVNGTTDPGIRERAIRELKRGDIKQLVNCDLFGEGTDLPAVEVCTFARPTESFGLYNQQFGRCLRLSGNKTHGIIIDPVRNIRVQLGSQTVGRHPLPDSPQFWTLDRREKRVKSDREATTIRTCGSCFASFDRIAHGLTCPYCGYVYAPVARTGPDMVDGDLAEIDPVVLANWRYQIDSPKIPYGASRIVELSIIKRHRERLEALEQLKHEMAMWASGKTDIRAAQREFYIKYGIDVLTAQTLNKAEALELKQRIAK